MSEIRMSFTSSHSVYFDEEKYEISSQERGHLLGSVMAEDFNHAAKLVYSNLAYYRSEYPNYEYTRSLVWLALKCIEENHPEVLI